MLYITFDAIGESLFLISCSSIFKLIVLQGTSYEEFDSSCVFQLAHAGQNPLIFCADLGLVQRYAL